MTDSPDLTITAALDWLTEVGGYVRFHDGPALVRVTVVDDDSPTQRATSQVWIDHFPTKEAALLHAVAAAREQYDLGRADGWFAWQTAETKGWRDGRPGW